MANLLEAVSSLFGFEIKRPVEPDAPAFSPRIEDDGAAIITAGNFYGTYVDLEGSVKTEAELVNKYRDMTLNSEVDSAIEDIVDEAIITEDGERPVQIILDDVDNGKMPPRLKELIEQEFNEIMRLLEFNTKSYNIFRRWYVDGRIYYHAMADPLNPQLGITELRYLDPRRIRKIREVTKARTPALPNVPIQKTINEYYIYTDKEMGSSNQGNNPNISTPATGIKIAKDSIIQATSGLTDPDGKMVIGYLHPAMKPLNQLRALEDATVIYRISRAPERRIFYIDVGSLPKLKAEQYVRDMMNKHKNKLVYNAETGEIKDDRRMMTMLEDFWMPRREGGRGTEITTLPAGQNLGELADVEYFQNKLYKALKVPIGRMDSESVFNFGRSAEITRDEVKFAKFIDRLRLGFSVLFLRALERQLILKQICTPEEWDLWKGDIQFRYLRDNRYSELKDQDTWTGRLNMLNMFVPYVGRFVSNAWLRKNILKQTDQDITLMDAEIKKESKMPQYAIPMDPMMPGGGSFADNGIGSSFNGLGMPPPEKEEDEENPKDSKKSGPKQPLKN